MACKINLNGHLVVPLPPSNFYKLCSSHCSARSRQCSVSNRYCCLMARQLAWAFLTAVAAYAQVLSYRMSPSGIVKPSFILQRLSKLANRRLPILRFLRSLSFGQKCVCKRPTGQPCEFGLQMVIDKRERFLQSRDHSTISRSAHTYLHIELHSFFRLIETAKAPSEPTPAACVV